jgi:hypothetical protein
MPLRRRIGSISVAIAGNRATWAAVGIDRHGVILRQIYDSGQPAGTTVLFTREQWAAFVGEVADGRPSDNGAVVARHAEQTHVRPQGDEYVSHWHLESIETGGTLHFPAEDWESFRRAAAVGDLEVPAGQVRTRRNGRALALFLGACCLAAGLIAWPFSGASWAAIGAAAAAAIVAGGLYHRLTSGGWPREIDDVAQQSADLDRLWDKMYFLVPELFVLLGVGMPGLAGLVVGATTGDWRWAVTGLLVGTALPGLVVLVALGLGSDSLSAAHLLFAGCLIVGGVPAVLLGWMWSGDVRWLFIGGAILLGMVILVLLAAASTVLQDD